MNKLSKAIKINELEKDAFERKRGDKALQKAHDELEKRIEEQTAELSDSNALLKQEISERHRIEEALQESEKQLRHFSSCLLEVQENERKRIGMELHDSIAQTLVALKFSLERKLLEMNESKDSQGIILEDLVLMVQKSIDELRRIIVELRPTILDDLGILVTINWFCREYQSTYPKINIDKQMDIEEDKIPEPLKIIIFRVVQEAFGNVAKHSNAGLVRVCLKRVNRKIELLIEDNGEGFDMDDVSSRPNLMKGLGLSGMKERVGFSNGSLTVDSTHGEGTVVRASWPC